MAPDVLELSELRVTAEAHLASAGARLGRRARSALGEGDRAGRAPVLELPITVAVSVTLPLGPIVKEPDPSCWPTAGW